MSVVKVSYFSDLLCIWAYIAQARIDAVKQKFGDTVRFDHRFFSVFGHTASKIPTAWRDRGEYAGFNLHLREIAIEFPHIELNPDIWLKVRPPTSASAHLFLIAIQHLYQEQEDGAQGGSTTSIFKNVMWAFRCAFFRDCRDIARWDVLSDLAEPFGVDIGAVENRIHNGIAYSLLAKEYQEADKMGIEGSPSFVMNEGRQKLYGNVGFRIMEANIEELLRTPDREQASWC